MKVFFFGNNRVAVEVLSYLARRIDIVGLAVHPLDRARYRSELLALAPVPEADVYEGATLGEPATIQRIAAMGADLGVSVLYGYVFSAALIDAFPRGIINLHPSLLPWNRGVFPNVWSIVEGTPSGVTLHWVDSGVDTGDLIAQREVPIEPVDTGATLYRKLEAASVELFKDAWPSVEAGNAVRRPQDPSTGTYHRTRDVESIDRIDLDAPTTARKLLDVVRARTFRPHGGAWFRAANGRRVYVRVSLEYAE